MPTLLSDEGKRILQAERGVLRDLHGLLERLDTEPEKLAQLDDLIAHLSELFLVVVVGEFNAGKSSVLNALFGEKIMEEGPIPTTAKITLVRHGAESTTRQLSEYLVERRHPAELLRHLNLVDTPGTNSIVRRHQEITEDFIPRADLILFITSFDRPLSESERQFLSFIRDAWGKRLVFVLNKIDLAEPQELKQVIDYLEQSCRELMDFTPRIFPLSAERAFEAKKAGQTNTEDGFAAFERFLVETLAGPEQLAIKLTAPLDSAARLLHNADERLTARQGLLEEDKVQLEELRTHFTAQEAELREGYQRYLAEVDNLLLKMEKRGVQFLEDNIRVGKLRLLRDRDAFKEEFSRQVIRDSEREVEARLTDAVDWLLRNVLQVWNWTLARFDLARHTGGATPAHSDTLYNRAEVFEKIRREADRRIAAYDLNEEARRILENARSAAALFLGAEGIAAGIGTVAAVVIATTAADVTGGFIAAGALAIFGFLFLPRQKRKAIREFKERVDALRHELEQALRAQLELEIEEAMRRVYDLIAPFAGYVEKEETTLAATAEALTGVTARVEALRRDVRKSFGAVQLEG